MNEGARSGRWGPQQGFRPPSRAFSVQFLLVHLKDMGLPRFTPSSQPVPLLCTLPASLWCA